MAGKRNANKKISEAVPVEKGNVTVAEGQDLSDARVAEGVTEQDSPAGEAVNEPGMPDIPTEETAADPEDKDAPAADVLTKPEGMWPVSDKEEASEPGTVDTDAPEERIFRITCRNRISESVGGVEFVDGTGYTRDGFSASWFANKSGYTVSRAVSGEWGKRP